MIILSANEFVYTGAEAKVINTHFLAYLMKKKVCCHMISTLNHKLALSKKEQKGSSIKHETKNG